MGMASPRVERQDLDASQQMWRYFANNRIAGWARQYRLSLLFAATAVLVISVAAIAVNQTIGGLAENNLIRIAEENTVRDAEHMQAMLRRDHAMHTTSLTSGVAGGSGPETTHQTVALDLDRLTGPGGLPVRFPTLLEGLNIVKMNVFDLNGTTVWSTDSKTIGATKRESPFFANAAVGNPSSKLVQDHEIVHLDGVVRPIDVVETYVPLRATRGGEIFGVMELYRDLDDDVGLQVDDTRSTVLRTIVGAMGGLLLVLLGFIVVADRTIYRSRRRELAVVEEANSTLEARVQERTRELEEAQDQLVRSEKLAAIGQLAGGVAHDLRNPLGAIMNAIYYLKRKLSSTDVVQSNPRVEQFLQIAGEEVDHANQIIGDLMSFARVGVTSLSPTNLGKAVENALSNMEIRDNVHVVKKLDPDLPEIMADGDQLYRVFINLANNAQDAMPDGGELTVGARALDGYAEVAFQDTGVGIGEEDMKKIFDPLFTTKTKGTGLGLSVCQQMVAKHEGTIGVRSTLGEGSTFTVRLPLHSDGS